MSTKINLYKQSGTDVDTRVSFNVPRSLTYGLNARANDDGGVTESDNCEYNILNTLYGINYEPIPIQPETAAYLAATGITGTTEVNAINKLVYELKQNNLWSKMKAVYPFVTDNRNLFSYTEDFGNAAWTSSEVAIASNSTTAPDGTLTADTLTASTSNAAHYIFQSINTNSGSTVTFSCFVKNNGGNFVQLVAGAISFTISNPYQNFDLINGTLAQGTIPNSTIENVGNGWYRLTCTLTTTSTGAAYFFIAPILNSTTGRLDAFIGNGTSGAFIWGAQLELGSTATTYQPIATTQQAFISSQFKYNLVNPVDSDAAFRLVFNGGWNMSSQGATPNGTNGYADTKLVPNTQLTLNSVSFSAYSRNNFTPTGDQSLGCSSSPINLPLLAQSFTSSKVVNSYLYSFNAPDVMVSSSGQNLAAMFITTRTAANNAKSFRNTTQLASVTTQGQTTQPTNNFFFGAFQGFNFITNYSSFQYAFAHIGDGLTDTEAAILYSLVQQYQTFLNRAV